MHVCTCTHAQVDFAPLAAISKQVRAARAVDSSLFLTDSDYTKCVNVEKLIDSLSDQKDYLTKLMDLDGEMTPRAEPAPIHAYNVHISTHACPRNDGPGSAGATLRVSYRAYPGAEERTIDVDVDADNLLRTFKDEVEVKDEGFFGWRFQKVDGDKDKESGRNAYGAGHNVKDRRLFEARTAYAYVYVYVYVYVHAYVYVYVYVYVHAYVYVYVYVYAVSSRRARPTSSTSSSSTT